MTFIIRRKNFKKVSSLLLFILIMTIFSCMPQGLNKWAKLSAQRTIGVYVLDINQTKLGFYMKDTALYKKLQLNLKSDFTFEFNIPVPFIEGTKGVWTGATDPVDAESWNQLFFSDSHINADLKYGTQFSPPWTRDSILYINSNTPRKGQEPVSVVYFKKIKK